MLNLAFLNGTRWGYMVLVSTLFPLTVPVVTVAADEAGSDGQQAEIVLSAEPDSFTEGDTTPTEITIVAKLGSPAKSNQVLELSVPPPYSDYAVMDGTSLTIAKGTRTGSAILRFRPTLDDRVHEDTREIMIHAVYAEKSAKTSVKLIDDDAAPTFAILLADSRPNADGSTDITVTAKLGGDTTFDTPTTIRLGSPFAKEITIAARASESERKFTLDPIELIKHGTSKIDLTGITSRSAFTVKGMELNAVKMADLAIKEWSAAARASASTEKDYEAYLSRAVIVARHLNRGYRYLQDELRVQEVNVSLARAREKSEFQAALAAGTVEDYMEFLNRFPRGQTAVIARAELEAIKTDTVWQCLTIPMTRYRACDDCPEMVVIPPGTFWMGSPDSESGRYENEGPRHQVTVGDNTDIGSTAAFAVGMYEIKHGEFAMSDKKPQGGVCWTYEREENGYAWREREGRSWESPGYEVQDDFPAVCVSWNDAAQYLDWLKDVTEGEYRLLMEKEWEYVARAKKQTPYHYGDEITSQQAHYNYTKAPTSSDAFVPQPVSVDSFMPNEFGLYNVHGNVWEWVQDCWHEKYQSDSKNCDLRALRGGSWADEDARYVRSAMRGRNRPELRTSFTGFRVAQELTKESITNDYVHRCPIDVELSVDPITVTEKSDTTPVTVTAALDLAQSTDITVSLDLSGTAVEGTDYEATWAGSRSVTIDAGDTIATTTFMLTPIPDDNYELTETVTVNGRGSSVAVTFHNGVTLTDENDGVRLSVSRDSLRETDNATALKIEATLSKKRDTDTVVSLYLSGTATEGVDYSVTWADTMSSITIAAEKTTGTATLTVTPRSDSAYEGTGEIITVAGTSKAGLVIGADLTLTEDQRTYASRGRLSSS